MSREDGHRVDVPDERKKAFGERYQPRYSGVATFMRRPLREEPSEWEGIDIGIVGVPFDGGVTNRPGARHGPRHLRDQSTLMGVVNHQTGVRPHDLAEAADLGDVLIEGVYRLDEAIADIERHYDRIASAGIVPLTAGGDHSITLPIMRALARAHGGPLGLVHFDAHCDTGARAVRAQAPSRRTVQGGGGGRRARPEAHHPDRHPRTRRAAVGVQLRVGA